MGFQIGTRSTRAHRRVETFPDDEQWYVEGDGHSVGLTYDCEPVHGVGGTRTPYAAPETMPTLALLGEGNENDGGGRNMRTDQ